MSGTTERLMGSATPRRRRVGVLFFEALAGPTLAAACIAVGTASLVQLRADEPRLETPLLVLGGRLATTQRGMGGGGVIEGQS
jgi:hypothetical protein